MPPTLDYDMWLGPAPQDPTRPTAAIRRDTSGSTIIRSATWAAGRPSAGHHGLGQRRRPGRPDDGRRARARFPTEGLYNNVFNWDMRIQLGDGVKMTFKPGGDSTKFIGSEGWVRIRRGGIDAEPKSLLTSKIGPNDVHLIESPGHAQNFIDAVKSRKPTVSPLAHAVRSDIISQLCDIAVRLKRKITWDPKTTRIVSMSEMRAPWTL